ncbi:MAG TPA: GGDEF domain-containing protein [Thermoanaerobaculia bacterium]|jgi:diguanylate cyclase (GGDEF)-like protein|nr:GGDEF domain-containing protein [Thermoanaerobaculia bacterium]
MTDRPPEGLPTGDSAVLRRLRLLRLVYSGVAIVLVVAAGDFFYPMLDRRIGWLASDLVEAVIVGLILWTVSAPATRELSRSIRALDELRQRFYMESIHDPLTGLFNRRYFSARLAEEHERSRRYKLPLSLIAIDADHFKRINDELGHTAGDAALVVLARVLSERHRKTDVLARIGGEEFAVLLPNLGAAGARTLADELRRRVENEEMLLPSANGLLPRRITVSCGVAELSAADEFDFDLLRRADEMLYAAKKTRNRVA